MSLHYLGGPTRRRRPVQSFTPLDLFLPAGTIQGAWFDPSDISTLFQDSAGTTPVTAVEQPVGKVLDKSGRGNHATQATAGNRPTYRARYNLLLQSEDFSQGVWTKASVTLTSGFSDPLGGTNARKMIEGAATSAHSVQQILSSTGVTRVATFYVKAVERTFAQFYDATSGSLGLLVVNLTTGAVSQNTTSIGIAVTNAGNSWWRVAITMPSVTNDVGIAICSAATSSSVFGDSYLGDGASGILVFGADARVGSSTTFAYQSITTATSYNAVGFLPYLAFNGTSSAMATASIPFTAAQATAFVGVNNLGAGAGGFGVIFETGPNVSATAQSFDMFTTATTDFNSAASGTAAAQYLNDAVVSTLGATVLTTSYDVSVNSASTVVPRRNGASMSGTNTPGSFTTGTFGSNVLNIGARATPTFQSNMNLYGLIVRGASSTAAEIASTEAWMNARTGAF